MQEKKCLLNEPWFAFKKKLEILPKEKDALLKLNECLFEKETWHA
jgi:hypothetical protein